jgi:hypothetical protein
MHHGQPSGSEMVADHDQALGPCPTRVPEGLNDRSQAIHCLEQVQLRIRPVGHGLIGSGRCATIS